MSTPAYRISFSVDFTKSLRRLSAVALCLCLMLLLPICASAQNNPYKINDSLYAIYQKAYQRRAYADGLKMAGDMYREAVRLGDGKAQCLALSVTMFYYYYRNPDDEPGFRCAVKAMQDKALATGYRQYYYFGMTNTVNWLLLRKRTNEAMQYVGEFVKVSRKNNDMLGLFNGLNSLAQVHTSRMEYGVAAKTLGEALEVGGKYLPGQDMSTTRLKLVDCYSSRFDYPNAYAMASAGYRSSRTKSFRLRFLTEMMFAAMKLGERDEAQRCYDEYVKINGPVRDNTEEMWEYRVAIMQCVLKGDYVHAQELLDGFPKGHGRVQFRLEMLLSEAKGDFKTLAEQKNFFYGRWMELKDEVMSQNMAELGASFFNQKLSIENNILALERSRIENERRRADIARSQLQLANTELSLRNSSLELGKARANADMLRLASDRKKLESSRLKSRIKAERARHKTTELHILTFLTVFLVLVVASIHVLGVHRRITRRLRKIHNRLALNHVELKAARDRAVAADNVKTALIQNMTRDVNIPLNTITGFAQLIADRRATYSPEERAEYFRQVRESTDRMLAIVKDVLEKAQKQSYVLLVMLLVPLAGFAQNNPYKINDSLYKLYTEGSQKVRKKEALTIADRMYAEAKAMGDGKAQCLARTVTMFHYYYTRSNERAFDAAVKNMQDEALRTGYRQYYYFGFTNRINYRINGSKFREALTLAQDFVNRVRKSGDHYGLFYGLNSLGTVHQARNEIAIAIKTFREALEVGNKYVHDQDMATIYRKLAECYAGYFDYQGSYEMARIGYGVAKTNTIRLRLVYHMTFAQLKLQNYDRVKELYGQYVKLGGNSSKMRDMSTEDREMLICYDIANGNEDEARQLITGMDRFFLTRQLRLAMSYCQRFGKYEKMAEFQQTYYGIRIANQDSMNIGDIVKLNSLLYNQSMLIDHRQLEMERQRILNEHQRTAIDNANLELSNTRLKLNNSSLELGRARADADRLQLANTNKRLETDRIKSRLEAEKARHETFCLHATTAIAVVAVLIVAALMYVRIHRRVTQRLRSIHNSLAVNHIELKKARDHALAASNVKTALIQNMTRDVNIPLNTITGFAQLIADRRATYSPEERAEYFRQIRESTDRMLAIVKDVLEKAQVNGN